MADITPNIVVSMPSQIFTQRREFKSCSNGKIYIGKIDTDPTIAENQMPVYLENEDGKYTRVAQPLIIGTGGYPVYNGQIAKFMTEEGHAMAVYDGDGVQQFYFPNVLKYEPKKAIKELYDALDKKFDKTGGTVNGDVIVEGNLTLMKGDNRKHFCIQNQDGRARMWLYKDKGGDGIHLNNGEDGGGDWLFHKNGNLHAPASIFAGGGATFGGNVIVSWGGRTATFHENGDVAGPIWGGALSGWLNNQLNNRGTKNTAQKAQDGWWQCGDTGVIEQWGLANAVGDYVTIRFPREFSSGCWNVVITPVDADNKIHVRERSRTSFNVYTSVSLDGKRFFWRAIGE